jgi:ribonuclease BN (tRNA processing enzyme)
MKLRVLGCSGAEFPGHNTSAFLIDDTLLIDAGTVGAVLDEEQQLTLKHIFITHPHLDHIKGIPLYADNLALMNQNQNVKLVSTSEILQSIRMHLMNDIIWPDFSIIPSFHSPVLSYVEIAPETEFRCCDHSITAYPVNHTVPAVGYIIRKGETSVLYTGDTGATERIWEKAGDLTAVIIEASLPNEMEQMAYITGHLTPHLLSLELKKLKRLPSRILVSHLKPQFTEQIRKELTDLKIDGLEILADGAEFIL